MKRDNKKIRIRRVYWLRKIKISKGCEYCGYKKSPLALDFAHKNPLDKHIAMVSYRGGNGINNLYNRISTKDKEKNTLYIKELFEEIRKCRILCKNCHVVETDKNREFYSSEVRRQRGGSYKQRLSISTQKHASSLEDFFG